MRWLKIVGGLVAVLVVVAIGGLVYLSTLDAEEFRQPIAAAVKEATGRDFKIAGAMDLGISLQPSIVANDISFGNAKWGSRPEMAKIKRFEIVVRLLPLISGQVSIVRINLVEADILLESDKKGRGNWQFEAAGAGKKADGGDTDAGAAELPSVDEIRIENSVLVFKDGASGDSRKISLKNVSAVGDPIDFKASVVVDGNAIKASGSIGPLANLAGGDEVDIDVVIKALGLTVAAKGKAQDQKADLAVTVAADNLDGLKALAGEGLPNGVPLNISAKLKGSAEMLALSALKLKLGNSDLAGSANIALKGKRPAIKAKLSGQKLDLAQLLPARSAPAKAKKKGGGKAANRVFPDDPLPLDGLRAVDADLSLKLAEVVTSQLTLRDVTIGVALKAGRLALKPVDLLVADSKVTASVQLNAAKKVPALKLSIKAPKLDVGKLLKETGTSDMLEGTANFGIDVSGSGRSVAAIMASLNGDTRVLMDNGRMRTKAFDLAVGGLSAVMGGLFSDKKEWTVLNCAANKFDIKNGIAVAKVMLIDAEYSTVRGEGKVNLGTEKLALKVTPESKSATLNLAVPIKVGGTFVEPTFRPDELAAATKIGGLLAGAAFPPAALLSLADMGSGEEHPCLKLASSAGKGGQQSGTQSKSSVDKASDTVKGAAGAAGDAAKGAVDSVTKGLKSLFGKD